MVDITGSTGEPWQVTMSRTGDGYVVHLIIGGVMVILPALEAHKLGSALHAASGLDVPDVPALRIACTECDGTGCTTCKGRGWVISARFFGDESSAGGAGSASPDPTPTTGAPGVAPSGAPPIEFCLNCGTLMESAP